VFRVAGFIIRVSGFGFRVSEGAGTKANRAATRECVVADAERESVCDRVRVRVRVREC